MLNPLSRAMLRLIMDQLKVGDQAPTYVLKLKKPEDFYKPPIDLTIPDGGVVSIDVSRSDNYGAATATVVIENCYGVKSPEFEVSKHKTDSYYFYEMQKNRYQRQYTELLQPETWIQICLGYGNLVVPVLTGAIDSTKIVSEEAKITLEIRDNMRYAIDQTFDPMVHGMQLRYPREDNLFVTSAGLHEPTSKVTTVRVKNADPMIDIMSSPSKSSAKKGRAYNGDIFQYLGEVKDSSGKKWYKIKFNNETCYIESTFGEVYLSNETISVSGKIKVDPSKAEKHVHVQSGPGLEYADYPSVDPSDILYYIQTDKSSAGTNWYKIKFNYNGNPTDGWIYSGWVAAPESATPNVKNINGHIHVKKEPSSSSGDIGEIYVGGEYKYIGTGIDNNGALWYRIEFKNENNVLIQGFVPSSAVGYHQTYNVLSTPNVVEVINVSSYLNIRSGPSTKHAILTQVTNGTILPYIATVSGEDGNSIWHQVLYTGRDGKQHEGYAHSNYLKLKSGTVEKYANNPDKIPPGSDIIVDTTVTVDSEKQKWTAAAVVFDLMTMATSIGATGSNPLELARTICKVLVSEFNILDNGEDSKYVINEAIFEIGTSYFDCAMEIINRLGNVKFECNRYGDIVLIPQRVASQYSTPDWEINDYVDLTQASLTYDINNIRSRILIKSDDGLSLFEHKKLASTVCHGVQRTMSMEVKFADTIDKRKEAARSAFEQMLSNWRKMTIAIQGNPLMEIGDIVRVYDMVTTSTSLFKVKELRHSFNDSGFITQLELEWVGRVNSEDIALISDDLPLYIKRFTYKLPFSGAAKPIMIKMGQVIHRSVIKFRNPQTYELLGTVELKGEYVEQNHDNIVLPDAIKYVRLDSDGVNIRTAANLLSTSVKKVRNAGFKMKYLGEEGEFYKGIDPEDNGTIYIWKAYCSLVESNGNSDTRTVSSKGTTQSFLDLIRGTVGCGYIWGADGEILTESLLKQLENTYGYSHYHQGNGADASKWMGKQVFDCSGLVVWALRKLNLIPAQADYTAQGIFESLCYEVSKDELKPGDLFFRQGASGIYHVGVVIENNQVIEARGLAYGVIQRNLPASERFGRLKMLDNTTLYTVDVDLDTAEIPVTTINTSIPIKYTVTTTYDTNKAPKSVKDKVTQLNGNLLFYHKDCILYYAGVQSDGEENNELVLRWYPMKNTPISLDLMYEILMY